LIWPFPLKNFFDCAAWSGFPGTSIPQSTKRKRPHGGEKSLCPARKSSPAYSPYIKVVIPIPLGTKTKKRPPPKPPESKNLKEEGRGSGKEKNNWNYPFGVFTHRHC